MLSGISKAAIFFISVWPWTCIFTYFNEISKVDGLAKCNYLSSFAFGRGGYLRAVVGYARWGVARGGWLRAVIACSRMVFVIEIPLGNSQLVIHWLMDAWDPIHWQISVIKKKPNALEKLITGAPSTAGNHHPRAITYREQTSPCTISVVIFLFLGQL